MGWLLVATPVLDNMASGPMPETPAPGAVTAILLESGKQSGKRTGGQSVIRLRGGHRSGQTGLMWTASLLALETAAGGEEVAAPEAEGGEEPRGGWHGRGRCRSGLHRDPRRQVVGRAGSANWTECPKEVCHWFAHSDRRRRKQGRRDRPCLCTIDRVNPRQYVALEAHAHWPASEVVDTCLAPPSKSMAWGADRKVLGRAETTHARLADTPMPMPWTARAPSIRSHRERWRAWTV